ncbi:hypothetical protein, partial [Accumulibacter sp.]|uniref:hypothetical protein n=1 Tax=Accumulibacter sp. TaxID=2053492 RepID=UPI00260E1089
RVARRGVADQFGEQVGIGHVWVRWGNRVVADFNGMRRGDREIIPIGLKGAASRAGVQAVPRFRVAGTRP